MTTYTIFVLYRALPAWLQLTRSERNDIFTAEVAPILANYQPNVSTRLFDAETFHARVSDVLLLTCTDLRDYYFLMESLRDTSLFGKPYIELVDVIVSVEDGFREFEASQNSHETNK
ncbi:darcynin family protein [Spirosoma panaciterrae]|uniref:darcynin family protein n=1 Tax=Spirosoma panaciterrae TaxID=496058 RepID=UPI00036C1C89|nr:darcynin family protein [Spirosoma panaciterrae]